MKQKIVKCCLVGVIVLSLLWIFYMIFMLFQYKNHVEKKDEVEGIQEVARLRIVNPSIRIDSVPRDSIVIADFVLINEGDEQLFISNINPDCTCSSFYINRNCVNPGDTSIISIKVDTHNRYGENLINTVFNANTENKIHILKLYYSVQDEDPEIEFLPLSLSETEIDLGLVHLGKPYTYSLSVINNSSDDIVLLDYYIPCPCIKVLCGNPIILGHASTTLDVEYTGDAVGKFIKTIAIRYTGSEDLIKFTVMGEVY